MTTAVGSVAWPVASCCDASAAWFWRSVSLEIWPVRMFPKPPGVSVAGVLSAPPMFHSAPWVTKLGSMTGRQRRISSVLENICLAVFIAVTFAS